MTMPNDTIRYEVATPDAAPAVTGLLQACYPMLMAPAYPPEILFETLPLMTRALEPSSSTTTGMSLALKS